MTLMINFAPMSPSSVRSCCGMKQSEQIKREAENGLSINIGLFLNIHYSRSDG